MKILQFQAENFLRLKVINITPTGTTIRLMGPNGQGKSSVLDAILAALAGNRALPEKPIYRGETTAHIRLELDEWIVTRAFTEKGSYLKVESKDGAAFKSPQALLDKVVGQLAFDPLKFAAADTKTQRAWLLQAIDFTVRQADLEALTDRVVVGSTAWDTLQNTRKAVFEARTNVNRRKDQAAKALQQLPDVEATEPVQLADLLAAQSQLQAALAQQAEWRKKAAYERNRVDLLHGEIADLEAALDDKRQALQSAQGMEAAYAKVVAALPVIDVASLQHRMATADQQNQQAAQWHQRQAVQTQLDAVTAEADGLTNQLAALDAYQQRQLASTALPIDGLTLVEDQVYYHDVPFRQASQAERWQVSTAIAMALNPTLRVMRVENAAVLDQAHLAWLEQLAADQDYQLWIELVADKAEGVGIYIEDGQVAAIDGQRVEDAVES